MSDVKIFASIVDDVTKKQVDTLAASEAYSGCKIRVMPDCHAGKGCTIGTVIQFKDRIVPNTVGVDIGCGMLVVSLGDVHVDLKRLDEVINRFIPSGFNIHDAPVGLWDANLDSLIAPLNDKDYILRSIGTLGGGNHFIELNEDEDGMKYLVIHSGSRNLGVQVCNYWKKRGIEKLTDNSDVRNALINQYLAEGRKSEIGEALKRLQRPQIDEDLAYIEGDDYEGYLNDMRVCQDYAAHNRFMMADIILDNLGIESLDEFHTIHNYIDIENHIIRKGAIAAPSGREVIIPMNMRDVSLICYGKGNDDWLCSAPHGAGRVLSRSQAIKQLSVDEFKKSMEGIYTTSVCEGTLDESPMVYKPAEQIMEDIKDTVEIKHVIKPIYNFKAKTPETERMLKSK